MDSATENCEARFEAETRATAAATPLMIASRLTVGYDRRRPILNDLDIAIRAGEIIGLVGPNGVGKTCLISTLAGAIPSLSGTIEAADGVSIALVPQSNGLYPVLSVARNVAVFLQARGIRPTRERIRGLLEPLDIDSLHTRRVGHLSGGEQKRVSIACGLASGATVLLLDEPSANLDSVSRHALVGMLRRSVRERPDVAFVVSSHDIREIEELCSHVHVFVDGACVASGTPQAIVRELGREQIRLEVSQSGMAALRARLDAAADHVSTEPNTLVGHFSGSGDAIRFLRSLSEDEAGTLNAVHATRGSLEEALVEAFRNQLRKPTP